MIKYILIPFLLSLGACTTLYPKQMTKTYVSKVFSASYEKVWRAAMLAMENYPIESEDNEKGIIKTKFIRGDQIWRLPFKTAVDNKDLTYTIQIKLIKGHIKDENRVAVEIVKKVFIQKGFIEDPVSINSTGLQEKNILYRIMREINIDKRLTQELRRS